MVRVEIPRSIYEDLRRELDEPQVRAWFKTGEHPVSNLAFFLGGGGGPSPASAATRGLPRLGA
jgi:hypothetical protein